MAQQQGFLESLGVGAVDEKDAVSAQRDALLNKVEQARTAQGRTAGRGVAGLLGGVTSIIRKRSFKGAGEAALESFSQATDRDVAQSTGLTVKQIQGRREIRRLAGDVSNDGSFKDRIALAKQIADIANRAGDSEVLGSALKRISDLRTEQEEFDKLQAVTTEAEAEAELSDVVDATYKGEDVVGTVSRDEEGNKGLKFFKDGVLQFVPWGDELQRRGTTALKPGMTDAELFSKVLGKSVFNSVRKNLTANVTIVRKYDSVLSALKDVASRGNIQGVVGNAGRIISVMDNTVRTVRGLLKNFAPGSTFTQDDRLLKKWRGKTNPNDSLWNLIELPEWARGQSADAQNYRSQVIELAYIAARAAEPSNRGLSDKDIQAAMEKLGASSGNPMVMFRRSMEIVFAGSRVIDDELESHYGQKRRDGTTISDADVDRIFAGRLLGNYRQSLKDLYTKFEVDLTEDGRAIFRNPLDITVNPIITPEGGAQPRRAETDLPDISDDDYNKALDGLF